MEDYIVSSSLTLSFQEPHLWPELTLFTYNATTGDVGSAVTDLDFTWEVPVSFRAFSRLK